MPSKLREKLTSTANTTTSVSNSPSQPQPPHPLSHLPLHSFCVRACVRACVCVCVCVCVRERERERETETETERDRQRQRQRDRARIYVREQACLRPSLIVCVCVGGRVCVSVRTRTRAHPCSCYSVELTFSIAVVKEKMLYTTPNQTIYKKNRKKNSGSRQSVPEPHSEHRFPAPSSKRKDVANQCLEFVPEHASGTTACLSEPSAAANGSNAFQTFCPQR